MRYTDEEDYRALINKIMQIHDGGVKYFGLSPTTYPNNSIT